MRGNSYSAIAYKRYLAIIIAQLEKKSTVLRQNAPFFLYVLYRICLHAYGGERNYPHHLKFLSKKIEKPLEIFNFI
ncbi:MAG: hypothetical protein K2L51_04580, partial [Clostridiales bacterium]|nr:hypothetical protein [Clostridiales bacterium]